MSTTQLATAYADLRTGSKIAVEAWKAERIELLAALELALSYVDHEASKNPTAYHNLQRKHQAIADAKAIRAAIFKATGADQ